MAMIWKTFGRTKAMKTMITKFAAAALMLAAVACQREELEGGKTPGAPSENLVPMTITASLESDDDAQARTALQSDGKVYWESGDKLTVMAVDEAGDLSASYEFATEGSGAKADFSGLVGEETAGLSAGWYAVYPPTIGETNPYLYATKGYSGYTHRVASGSLSMFMPSTQFASSDASGLYSLSAGLVADDEEKTLTMKNVGGLIAITLPAQEITSVILYGNSGEMLAGKVTAAFSDDGTPVISEVSGSNMIHLIPAVEGDTFAAGTYYINVAPVTFSNGLTLLFTNKSSQYATVRTTASFVVERSKVSPLPVMPTLDFGGKVVEFSYSNNYKVTGGVGGKNTPLYRTGDIKDLPTSKGDGLSGVNELTDGTYNYVVSASKLFVNGGYSGGICFGPNVGEYFSLPKIDGYALNKVAMRNGAYQYVSQGEPCLTTRPDAEGNYTQLPTCSKWAGNVQGGMEYIWSLAGDPSEEYAITLTTKSNETQYCRIQVLRLFYAKVPTDGSAINPLITDVSSSEPTIEYDAQKVTLNASFSAVDYSALSQFSCGFQYKLKSAADWTSVTCTTTAMDFSYELTLAEAGEYEYRPWVKIEKTGKTVYGDAGSFDSSTIVLSLVFDDSFWDRTPEGKNANFLVREWGWNTNQNTYNLWNNNGREAYSYNFKYNGVDYQFNFWTVAGLPKYDEDGNTIDEDEDGNTDLYAASNTCTLHVYGAGEVTRGLCLTYSNSGSPHAWMQLPGVDNFKLASITGDLHNRFTIEINDAVDRTSKNTNLGTPSGNKVGYQTGKLVMDMSFKDTRAGVRYYFCSIGTRPTIKNMTLTYEYAGE